MGFNDALPWLGGACVLFAGVSFHVAGSCVYLATVRADSAEYGRYRGVLRLALLAGTVGLGLLAFWDSPPRKWFLIGGLAVGLVLYCPLGVRFGMRVGRDMVLREAKARLLREGLSKEDAHSAAETEVSAAESGRFF